MSVEIADIRAGLQTNLETVAESRQVLQYPTGNPTPPSLVVLGFDKTIRTGFGTRAGAGSYELSFLVQGLAGLATEKSAHLRLDKWLSPLGTLNVWKAIESDTTLGGKVSQTFVTECDGYQLITVKPGVEYLGSTWHVQIEL
jgi:hypothetical protein